MEVVQALIDACPAAILECDDEGNLPVHHMLRCRRFQYARALIKANTAGLKLIDNWGNLPIHAAVLNGVNVETFNSILQGYPEACKIPLECALRSDVVDFEVRGSCPGLYRFLEDRGFVWPPLSVPRDLLGAPPRFAHLVRESLLL